MLTRVGAGAGIRAMGSVVTAGLAAGALSGGPAHLAVAPSQGLATVSVFGPHLAPRILEGPHRLDQVGLETDMRATVASCAELPAVGTLSEARAAAGDDIGPPRQGLGGGNSAHCIIESGLALRGGAWSPGAPLGQPILCEHHPLSCESPPSRWAP